MAVQQGVATAKQNSDGVEFLSGFMQESKQSGLIDSLIKKYRVTGLTVAA